MKAVVTLPVILLLNLEPFPVVKVKVEGEAVGTSKPRVFDTNPNNIMSNLTDECYRPKLSHSMAAGRLGRQNVDATDLRCSECGPVMGAECEEEDLVTCDGREGYSCYTFRGAIEDRDGNLEKGCFDESDMCAMQGLNHSTNECRNSLGIVILHDSVYSGQFCFCKDNKCNEDASKSKFDDASTSLLPASLTLILSSATTIMLCTSGPMPSQQLFS